MSRGSAVRAQEKGCALDEVLCEVVDFACLKSASGKLPFPVVE